jgi:hypothetical protein
MPYRLSRHRHAWRCLNTWRCWTASCARRARDRADRPRSHVVSGRRRWLCLQYLGYWSLGPLFAWRVNDRNVAETVSWATGGDRPDTVLKRRWPNWGECQDLADSVNSPAEPRWLLCAPAAGQHVVPPACPKAAVSIAHTRCVKCRHFRAHRADAKRASCRQTRLPEANPPDSLRVCTASAPCGPRFAHHRVAAR